MSPKSVGDGRLARSILTVLVELRHRPHLTAVDEVAVELHRAVFGEELALICDRIAADRHTLARLELLRERLAGTAREHHREERQGDAAVRNHGAEAQHPAVPADEGRTEQQDGDGRKHEQPRGVHTRHKRERDADCEQGSGQEPAELLCLTAVAQAARRRHDEAHGDGQWKRRAHIEVRVDGGRLADELRKERHRHADEDDGRDKHEHERAQEQAELAARMRLIEFPLRQIARLDGKQRQAADEHNRIDDGQCHADARAAEGMHREIAEDAAARQERAVDDEREREDDREVQHGERRRPPLGDVQDVDESASEQPRHERGVLDRVPAPVATPPEHLIGPVAADEDARAEEAPGK